LPSFPQMSCILLISMDMHTYITTVFWSATANKISEGFNRLPLDATWEQSKYIWDPSYKRSTSNRETAIHSYLLCMKVLHTLPLLTNKRQTIGIHTYTKGSYIKWHLSNTIYTDLHIEGLIVLHTMKSIFELSHVNRKYSFAVSFTAWHLQCAIHSNSECT
jgi:hypothetical protein